MAHQGRAAPAHQRTLSGSRFLQREPSRFMRKVAATGGMDQWTVTSKFVTAEIEQCSVSRFLSQPPLPLVSQFLVPLANSILASARRLRALYRSKHFMKPFR